jgi:multiple sugar transport system permease protein
MPTRRSRTLLMWLAGCETPQQLHYALRGYLYVTPWLLGLILFVGGPIIASLLLSFTSYDILSAPKFVGLANFQKAFFEDSLFWPSLGRTFLYAVIVVPASLIGSLLLATLLNQGKRGTNVFRTLFYLPHLTPAVAMAILWTWLLDPDLGPINLFLKNIGLPQPGWLADAGWALPSLVLISLWASLGGNTMLIFLAGLQGVPEELYEAAQIDGAGAVARLYHITLPMISPTLFFNLILGMIGALKVFNLAFIATGGGPSYATWFFALHIYQQAFQYYRMGYGSALAWVFMVILLALTAIQLATSRRWVYYQGGDGDKR